MTVVTQVLMSAPGDGARANLLRSHAPPSWVEVARSQHLLLLQSGRVLFLFGLVLMALVVPDVVRMAELANGPLPTTPLGPVPAAQQLLAWSVWIAPIWALFVWRRETRGRRAYHASLPVERAVHDVWRVAAGATWLVAILIAIMPIAVMLAVIGDTPRLFLFGAEFWANYIVLPLFAYLVCSLLPLLTRRALTVGLRIVLGAFVLLYVVLAGWSWLAQRVIAGSAWLIHTKFGLNTALLGGLNIARRHAFELEGSSTRGMSAPSTSDFLIASALWLALAAVAVAIAARRSPP